MDIEKLLNARGIRVTILDVWNIKGGHIRKFREQNNLSQIAMAGILNVSKRAIIKWERNDTRLKGSTAMLMGLLFSHPECLHHIYSCEQVIVGVHDNDKE